MNYDRFKKRVDTLPVGSLSTKELQTRIAIADAELEQLSWDEVHIESETHGVEKLGYLRVLEKERSEAKALRKTLSEELRKRAA